MAYFKNNGCRQVMQGMNGIQGMQTAPAMPYITCGAMPPYMNQQGQGIPAYPSGIPTGPSTAGALPAGQQMISAPPGEQAPQTVESTMYTPGFLRTQIGRNIRVEFLIGTNGPMVDRMGTLLAVGASYILLRPTDSDDILMCDIYSIKFVTILL